jgi:tetratricopeptide (TPR) repeat protein
MKSSGPPPSRLLLRLVLSLEDCNLPTSAWRRTAADGGAGLPERLSESAWQYLESLRVRFEAELAFADSCLADDPPRSRVQMLLDNSSELRRVAILQRFIQRAYSFRLHHPREGLEISDDLIAWTRQDRSPLVATLRGRAFMERGNFLRILGDPRGAHEALAQAASELEANGTGDPLEVARYQELLGTLERDCGNFEAAARLLRNALTKVRLWGNPHFLQRVLVATALNDLYRDEFEEAQALLDESLRVAPPDSLFMRYAVINKVLAHYFAGESPKAYKTLLRVQGSMGQSWLRGFPQANQMSVLWTEGQILNTLHQHDEAVDRLKQAREFYIQAAQGSKVGQISIELALSHAVRDNYADVRRELALGLQFCSERTALDRQAKEALLLLQGTLEHQDRLDAEQIRSLDHRLDVLHRAPLKAWDQPFEGLPL